MTTWTPLTNFDGDSTAWQRVAAASTKASVLWVERKDNIHTMWIFLSDSFLSIVQSDLGPELLLVRARKADDIKNVFPHATVHRTPDRDYLYRAVMTRGDVAETIAAEIDLHVTYPNFKDSVAETDRHNAYAAVWAVMADWQEDNS